MSERIIVVTGAGSGIGRSVAQAFASGGARVVLAGRKPDALLETIKSSGIDEDRFLAVATDVKDPAAVDRLFDATKARFGRIDVLFNNAEIGRAHV